jgi:ketosteroid isomerase-like protein
MDIATPQGGLLTLHISDWIRTRGERITEQRIYYDAREFAKAFGM